MASEEIQQAETHERLHAVIYGRVQGVNFRYNALRTAQRLDLTGWVANRRDGTVEVVAEGPREALRQFRSFLERGSASALVERVNDRWGPATREFDSFLVRFQ